MDGISESIKTATLEASVQQKSIALAAQKRPPTEDLDKFEGAILPLSSPSSRCQPSRKKTRTRRVSKGVEPCLLYDLCKDLDLNSISQVAVEDFPNDGVQVISWGKKLTTK
jgi:hypothetical protein